MKSPDEIKKGLVICYYDGSINKCVRCPYSDGTCGNDINAIEKDALALIQQLEAENSRYHQETTEMYAEMCMLREKVHRLEAERDAAVAGLKSNCTCPECKYFSDDIQDPCRGCKPNASKFEWRGVQKEATP